MLFLVELPQGVVIEVRRGGHDALAKLSGDMVTLGISGYIRIERRPKGIIPRVSQVMIDDGVPRIALHESDLLLTGLEALLEIERDSMALDSLISLIELSDDDIVRIVNLYPDAVIVAEQKDDVVERDDWWNYVRLNSSSWRREERLPEQEATIDAPEYIRQITKAKLQKFATDELILNYGDSLLRDTHSCDDLFELAGILAAHGRPILVISRTDSNHLLDLFSIPKQASYVISSLEGDNYINANMSEIEMLINQFLWANKQAVVVLSGLEYLLSLNDFNPFISALRNIVDNIRNGDHLLLSNCDLDVFENMQRHSFVKEYELINGSLVEALNMDPESLIDHPICMVLTDEELSWIQQQVNFISAENTEYQLLQGILSGGANNLATEDVVAVSGELANLVDDWSNGQTPIDDVVEPLEKTRITSIPVIKSIDKKISDSTLVFEELGKPIEQKVVIIDNNLTNQPIKEKDSKKAKTRGPRKALRVKRVKKNRVRTSNGQVNNSKLSLDAAAQSNVELPEMSNLSVSNAPRQVIDVDLVKRSEKIEGALADLLSKPLTFNSAELSEVVTQTASKSNYDLPSIKSPKAIKVEHNLVSTRENSPTTQSDSNKQVAKTSRESASRTQNHLDVDRNYHDWVTQYGKSDDDNIDLTGVED